MISIIAHYCLLISIASSIAAISFAIKEKIRFAIYSMRAQTIFVITSFGCLVAAFFTSDFTIQNVFLHSSSITPILFKISGAWASHEGSQLLWFTLLSIVSYITLNNKFLAANSEILKTAILIITPILLSLCLFIYHAANPFTTFSITPHQGVGLNPILQDAALAIHPPILYLGYVIYIAPFTYSCLALLHPSHFNELMKAAVRFSKIGWLMLLVGISLGSWWAYRELGWGGYWFFDPVENVSLIPLIMATSFHHSLIFTLHNAKLSRWTLFFGLNIFPITLIGSFLVRSGMLTSVHSFADAGYTEVLLLIFISVFCFGNILYLTKFRSLSSPVLFPKSKEQGIFFANLFWLASVITILFSIIYPVILKLIGHDITVQLKYFTHTFIPLLVPIILLAGSFAYFKAKNLSYRDYYLSIIISIISCIVIYLTLQITGILLYIILFSSIFLLFSTIFKLLEKSPYFSVSLSNKMLSMLLGHFGFGLLTLSIALNTSLQSEIDFIGKIGHTLKAKEYNVTLKNIHFDEIDNYYTQTAEFWIEPAKGKTIILKPENRLYKIEQAITAESSIYSYLTADVYAVLNKVNENTIHAKIYYRPYISFIWLSLMIMALGILVSISNYKTKPAKA
jgi:cytochrome c-type biogenesis protein CcmF